MRSIFVEGAPRHRASQQSQHESQDSVEPRLWDPSKRARGRQQEQHPEDHIEVSTLPMPNPVTAAMPLARTGAINTSASSHKRYTLTFVYDCRS